MKGFNLASGASSGSGSDANMQIKFSGKFFEQFVTVAAFYLMEIWKFIFIKISFTHVVFKFNLLSISMKLIKHVWRDKLSQYLYVLFDFLLLFFFDIYLCKCNVT